MSKTYVEILAEYQILALSTTRYSEYVAIKHRPCQQLCFGRGGDPRELDAAALMALIDAHECEARDGD